MLMCRAAVQQKDPATGQGHRQSPMHVQLRVADCASLNSSLATATLHLQLVRPMIMLKPGELPTPSPMGDESPMSTHPAPQHPSLTAQGHQWEVDTSPLQDENVPHCGKVRTGPYERLRSRGAHEQLQALHHIDCLQRAGMERKMAEVSNTLSLIALLMRPCLIILQL